MYMSLDIKSTGNLSLNVLSSYKKCLCCYPCSSPSIITSFMKLGDISTSVIGHSDGSTKFPVSLFKTFSC